MDEQSPFDAYKASKFFLVISCALGLFHLLPYSLMAIPWFLTMFGVWSLLSLAGLGLALWSAVRQKKRRAWLLAAAQLPLFVLSLCAALWSWYAAAHF